MLDTQKMITKTTQHLHIPPEQRFICVRWRVVEIRNANKALSFIVSEYFFHVRVNISPRVVQKHPRHSQFFDQLQPLQEAQGEVFVQIVESGAANANAPFGRCAVG